MTPAARDPGRRGITGLVLAGGRGTRMGRVEKGLEPFRGRPLVAHVIERLAPQVDEVLISANRLRERYEALGAATVSDEDVGHGADVGPLAGLAAGLARTPYDRLLAVPCDAPFLPLDLAARLHEADDEAPVVAAATRAGRQPVFCLVRRVSLPSLRAFVASGGRGVGEWIASVGGDWVMFDDEAAFRNLNTREDLEDAARAGGWSAA